MIKNNKEKIFELKIQEDDDVSGIDSISLVDDPAIEVNWVSFKKEQHDFQEDDDVYVQHLMTKGETEEELLENGWSIDTIEYLDGKDNFVETHPNEPSGQDEVEYKVRYKYILNPKIKGEPAIIPTSRPFCKELIAQNKVFRIEDIDTAINDFGQSPRVYRGSWNCRHIWSRIKYKNDAKIINKASINIGKVMVDGVPSGLEPDPLAGQPDTVTERTKKNPKPSTIKNLGLSKEGFADKPKVSIDYDGTLSTPQGEELAKELIAEGNDVYIVTRRNELEGAPIIAKAKELRIPQANVFFTNGEPKWQVLKSIGITKHYDNNPDEIASIKKNVPTIDAQQFDYEVGTIGGYVDPGLKKKPIKKGLLESDYLNQFDYLTNGKVTCVNCGWEWNLKDGGNDPYICHKCGYDNSPQSQNFASHSDYPQEVKDVAKRVLDWVDKNGWGSCGTNVGKQRANQLANGEAISEETIHRMYSYLSRHKGDLKASKSYEDGCGKLMYDSWGGAPGLQWAERKIQILNKHRMAKQKFATDDEKHIVLGPAMIPDMKIFRKDAQGNPYYVYFSPETIKMIASKYMKNKYTDNNDMMHDGEAVPDVYVMESWIKESNNDKSTDYGYKDLPVGTWFVSMKVNNPEIWDKVKSHQLNGFSVSGYFEEVAQFCREEMFLQKVADILKNIKE
jgi:hypothetical protein